MPVTEFAGVFVGFLTAVVGEVGLPRLVDLLDGDTLFGPAGRAEVTITGERIGIAELVGTRLMNGAVRFNEAVGVVVFVGLPQVCLGVLEDGVRTVVGLLVRFQLVIDVVANDESDEVTQIGVILAVAIEIRGSLILDLGVVRFEVPGRGLPVDDDVGR